VFLDGFKYKGQNHYAVRSDCYRWLKEDQENRRLVVICSLSARFKNTDEEDAEYKIKDFTVCSWTKQE
jgi:hypothetical protein